jgi:hypothetical protein
LEARETKARLERALHGPITSAEWTYLEDIGLVGDYENGGCDWPEFRRGAKDNLTNIRTFRVNDRREQAGELEDAYAEDSLDYQLENTPVDPQDSAFARGLALSALDRLRSGGSAPPRARMHITLLPRGGVDGTVPQWVHVTAVELWMPAEEVARAFRRMQRSLMAETDQPKTQARAFNVARFVWEIEAVHGGRLSWPEMCKRWNDFPMTRPFGSWRDFRRNFVRGAKATLPRYKATDEQITEQVREATIRGEAVAFDAWVSQVRAATVQQDTDQ